MINLLFKNILNIKRGVKSYGSYEFILQSSDTNIDVISMQKGGEFNE